MKILKLFSIIIINLLLINFSYADDFPERPNRLVNDYTNTLTSSQVQELENKLVAFDDSTTIQIAVVLIQSLQGYEVADYAVRLAQKWGIGGKENNSGILLLASLNDRKVTIQTGYGIEGAVPDAIAYQIINNEIKPAFARQDYFTGLDDATNALISYTKGEYKAKPKESNKGVSTSAIIFVVIFFIIISIISKGGNNGRGKGGGRIIGGRGSSDLLWWTLLGGLGNRGGGGFSNRGGGFSGGRGFGGGGGFGGFGGGGFGGGGASGGW